MRPRRRRLVRDQGIERSGGSWGMFGGQSATFFTQVRGVEPVQLQRAADALYEALVVELKARGVEVLPVAELDAQPDFQALRQAAKASPVTDGFEVGTGKNKHMAVNQLVSAKGLPIFVRNVLDERWLPGQAFPGEGYQGMALVLGPGKLAQALKAPMLNVRLTVALAEQKGKGWGGASARPDFVLNRWVRTAESRWEFETDPFVRFVEGATQMTLTNPGMDLQPAPNALRLKQALPIAGVALQGVKGEGGNARGSGLLGALGRAVGGGGKEAPADLYLDVDGEAFVERLVVEGRPLMKAYAEALTQAR
jgi:hypothetical protein